MKTGETDPQNAELKKDKTVLWRAAAQNSGREYRIEFSQKGKCVLVRYHHFVGREQHSSLIKTGL